MRVAVITPYFDEPLDWIRRCHESVLAQEVSATHFLVRDGPEAPDLPFRDAILTKLPRRHADFGDSPRIEAWRLAAAEGFDAVSFLDADNWYEPGHLSSLLDLHSRTGATICTSRRKLHRLDGSRMGICLNSDGETFCDTNCFLFTRAAFHWRSLLVSLPAWARPINDRVLWHAIRSSGERVANTGMHTVAYRTKFAGHYAAFRELPPGDIGAPKTLVEDALERWQALGMPSLAFELSVARA